MNTAGDDYLGYLVSSQYCPSCEAVIVYMQFGIVRGGDTGLVLSNREREIVLYPQANEAREVSIDIPDPYRQDLIEARAVLELSPKASAALSRRLLQRILREKLAIQGKDLSKEIDQFISAGSAPTYLLDAVDAIRHIGNLAAHPLKFQQSGDIADVEPGEAEWTLDVAEALLDFACVQPIKLKNRRDQLNKKLQALGKPLLKEK
ncbi:DUF4145 domain-containing protein [Xanthomonas cannabis]|uniref:DUF4145 domain-containing protein n=1 Tax=Xanthomonas cannabis TaxID=1885674 RepID=A0ABR6JSW5_9XANT|nr:DUF4145 domain-containing protein [Xanthomonas cannabis]MBB4595337.1 hypothetical protein [Xanthomonas cannabis]MBB5524161.1 hypothetical protein [Xanthomonas cannabis]